jgi:hypothetical protein
VVAVGTKRCDEVGGVIVEGIVLRDGKEEVLLDVFLLWAPDFLAAFIDNSILVRVVSNGSSIR